jgi:hypothetical protein
MDVDLDYLEKLLTIGFDMLYRHVDDKTYFIITESMRYEKEGKQLFMDRKITPITKSYLAIWLARGFGLEEYLKIEG